MDVWDDINPIHWLPVLKNLVTWSNSKYYYIRSNKTLYAAFHCLAIDNVMLIMMMIHPVVALSNRIHKSFLSPHVPMNTYIITHSGDIKYLGTKLEYAEKLNHQHTYICM